MKRLLIALLLIGAIVPALAEDTSPPAPAAPPDAEPAFYIVPAAELKSVINVIDAQMREIETLRRRLRDDKGCA